MSKIKSFKFFLLAITFLFATAISSQSLVVLAATAITSNLTQLVSSMGAGWNLGNQLEASSNGTPNETAWGNPKITKAFIQEVKASGFKTIRIPVSYLNKIGSAPNYTIDSAWLARIKEVVDYAYSQDMYIIVNMHGDGYSSINDSWLLCNSSDQTTIKAKYQKAWQQIANTFVNYNEHLIFESMNEEFDGTYGTPNATYYSNINSYNQIFVDTIRKTGGNNSARWLLIPGWNTNIDYTVGNYGFLLPTDTYRSTTVPSSEKRIMISAHYYSPWDFCGDQSGTITQWGTTAVNNAKKSTWGQEDYLNSQFKSMYDKFVTQGYPVVIGEYGSVDKTSADSTNNTYRSKFAKAVCSTAKQYGCVPVYWDNGYNGQYGFGLFNRSNCTITQQGIIDDIMSSMGTTNTSNSTITPITGTFEKNTSSQANVVVALALNGNTLNAIKNSTSELIFGTDYTVSNSTVIISKSYLAKQAVGNTILTFDFSAGTNPVLSINVTDSSKQPDTPTILYGDVNDDSDVDISDFTALQKYVLEGTGNINKANADINNDTRINTSDLFELRKIILES
jgi:aryl-phospho-beta-D-glucosidase BglC (GH1 family)